MGTSEGERLNELALFAGVGGGILASEYLLGHRVVCAVENESFCQEVLLQRQRDGLLPHFPIWDDAKTFDGKPWRGYVDLVSSGFPCTPHSHAGLQKGAADERDLWPDTMRIIREVRPRVVHLENVPGLISSGFIVGILEDLAEARYDANWCVLPAASPLVGANHIRKRWWLQAVNSDTDRSVVRHDE